MPTSREVQERRREAIIEILLGQDIRSQQELLEELKERGITATQSSISRDLSDIGAIRINGVYGFPRHPRGAEDEFKRVMEFIHYISSVGSCMTILKTEANAGPFVARAIDAGKWPEVVGTVAGPDSVLVLTDDTVDDQGRLWERLDRLFGWEENVFLDADDAGPELSRPRRVMALVPRSQSI